MALGSYRTQSGRTITQILTDYAEAAVGPLGSALYTEASAIMGQSQPLVPVDTGALRASGYVLEPVRTGDVLTVEFGYGGVAAKINPKTGESTAGYAIYVHENLEAHHPVGMAKYLEIPFSEAKTGMDSRIADRMKSSLAGGGAPQTYQTGFAADQDINVPEVGRDTADSRLAEHRGAAAARNYQTGRRR